MTGRLGPGEARAALAAPAPSTTLSSTFSLVDGLRTHVRTAGTAAGGMPVVLVHGLAVSHRYFTPLVGALAPDHPSYAPDLPGFGLSAKPAHAYDVPGHAAHLAAWLAAARLPPACVLGHSFGAEVAAALAAARPELVAALVLVGPTSDPAARSRRGQALRWLRDLPREAPDQVPIVLRDVWDAGPRRVLATLGHSVHNAIEADLAQVRTPTLVLCGARDPVAPPAWREQVRRLVPGATVAVVPGAAHNVVSTAGPRVAELVHRFLTAPSG